jgi:uncharacterized protein YegL
MTNPDRRLVVVILDRSGSMQRVKTDTEGGLKAFLDAQTEAPGHTTVSLYQFDDQYDVVYESKPLADVPPYRLLPRGATALFDAIGRTVAAVGEQLAALPEDNRPAEVIVVILTDGQENASREYTRAAVKGAITRQQEKFGWKFVFLGADQDAFAVSGAMGIGRDQTLSYGSSHTKQSMTNAGHMVARGTASGLYAFTDDERDESA